MLQGIFEPVAERKKGTLERILRDFPERRFLLVGDSGEADLEVYTDVVCENPGRILGVFIRDVTTTKQQFFDKAQNALNPSKNSDNRNAFDETNDPNVREAIRRSLADQGAKKPIERRPVLPPRRKTQPVEVEEDLIDLNFEPDPPGPPTPKENNASQAPPRPAKPRSLSSAPVEKTPPRPSKLSSSVQASSNDDPRLSQISEANDAPPQKPPRPTVLPDRTSSRTHADVRDGKAQPPPPPPPRKPLGNLPDRSMSVPAETAMPSTQARTDSERNSTSSSYSSYWGSGSAETQVSRKEEAWARRWTRARQILDRHGVMLRSWRVGEDIEHDATELVSKYLERPTKR